MIGVGILLIFEDLFIYRVVSRLKTFLFLILITFFLIILPFSIWTL